ncbi:VacJ family lipoprotein [Bacillus sp. NP157]|nr:VacJ family lipoprotein [Bacillus sp. NP157]
MPIASRATVPSADLALRRRRPPAWRSGMVAVTLLAASGCSHEVKRAPQQPTVAAPARDEPINRTVFAFNRGLDRVLLRPVARGYSHLPAPVRSGVRNFSQNLREPIVFANDLLQANSLRSLNTAGRFVVNSTVGVVGIFDVASHWGMPRHDADLGQTFGVWGIGPGHTVELPLFGSSNVRDSVGRILTLAFNHLGDNSDTVSTLNTAATVGGIVDGRARALPFTDRLEQSPDYYAALRDSAAARRTLLVEDGRRGDVHAVEAAGEGRSATGLPVNP